jgi:hypothetical protein
MTNPLNPYAELLQDALGADETSLYQALYDFFERTGRPWDTENMLNNIPRQQPANTPADKFSPAILAAALTIHGALILLNGFGEPNTGDGLTTGAVVFQDVSALLGSAGSDPGWQGVGAQSYDRQNSEQQNRTDQMAALDTQLAGLLQSQATEVKKLRNEMYIVGGTTRFRSTGRRYRRHSKQQRPSHV